MLEHMGYVEKPGVTYHNYVVFICRVEEYSGILGILRDCHTVFWNM